jgi:diadenylate cyclase
VGNFLENLLVVLVVVFHNEIRRGLARIGQWRLIGGQGNVLDLDVLGEIARSVFQLAKTRTGAIVLLERGMGLSEFVEHGRAMDALFSQDLAAAIFASSSPVHDGAIVIRGQRVAAAGVILPIPAESPATREMGTRHRAAFGVATETDAVAIVVSEETGNVTVFFDRNFRKVDTPEQLREVLGDLFRVEGSGRERV